MYGVSPQAYDRAITVFSPDGRLFQVEYAKEAVKRGATSLGIKVNEGLVLVATKVAFSRLVEKETIKKIFEVDDHIFLTASGLIADVRKLVDLARDEARRHRLVYNEPASVINVVKYVADIMQLYTQYGGARPFGVSLLVGGYDGGRLGLYEIEPSGAYTGYMADSIGEYKKEVDSILEKKYRPNLSIKEAIKLGITALVEVDSEWTSKSFEVAYIKSSEGIFKRLSEEEVAKLLPSKPKKRKKR